MRSLFTIAFLSVFCICAYAQKEEQFIAEGNKLYKKQQFEKAAQEYQKAAEKNDKNDKARYNMGNALYRLNKVEEAEKTFNSVAEHSAEKPIKTNAYYNKGVTLSQQKKLQESIEAYKQTLRLTPEDTEARENLQKALNELKQQQQQQQKPEPKKDDKKNNDQKDQKEQPQKNKSNLNEKQAERMLNALRQEEKAIQKDLQKNKNRAGGLPEKDW